MKSNPLPCFLAFCLFSQSAEAQSPVVSFTSTYVATNEVNNYNQTPAPGSGSFNGCNNSTYRYSFGNGAENALRLLGISTTGRSYFVTTNNAEVKIRRVDNTAVTGRRSVVFLESTNATASNCPGNGRISLKSAYEDEMEAFLKQNYINQGTDNLFTNTGNGDGNLNNIERVDVIFAAGMATPNTNDVGFALMDRGNNNGHDAFRIVAITGLDANGDPSSFGAVQTCRSGSGGNNADWGHPTIPNGNQNLAVYVMRKEANETRLRTSAAIHQQLGGVFFSLDDLGVAPSQRIYGYSLLAADGLANPSSAQLLDLNNRSVYPVNTTETAGGLDLVAVNASFSSGAPTLPVEITLFKNRATGGQQVIDWRVDNLSRGTLITLEHSRGDQFQPVVAMTSTKETEEFSQNITPQLGMNLYRLKISKDGRTVYSPVIKIEGKAGRVEMYPARLSPGQDLVIKGLPSGRYQVQCVAADGKLKNLSLTVQGHASRIPFQQLGLQRGIYFLQFINNAGQLFGNEKLIIQ